LSKAFGAKVGQLGKTGDGKGALRRSLRRQLKKSGGVLHLTAPGAIPPLLASGIIWEDVMAQKDAMTQEEVERQWFRKIVSVLLLGLLTFGAVPILKNTFFPVERSRR
jgi:hypothetical protein